ncbi:precursor of CEP6 [Lycium barbarum]|uniref:precursor of CEP6 n=1 Tax=Lycium barbarum TaxID=112863 RepID=UPI00293F20A1|nr:precursor of CEP6 [Lycium barbarum]
MACIKHICVFSFLLVVFACHQVLIAEGRQLKELKKTLLADNMRGKEIHERQRFSIGDTSTVATGKVNNIPTKTGNSPGIGHSSSVPKTNYQPKHTTVEGTVDDLKGGHSPGIGHASQNEKIGPNV